MKSTIDIWANFLSHEKLNPKYFLDKNDFLKILDLAIALSNKARPNLMGFDNRQINRRLVCQTALDMEQK